jgi:alpha-methylacyl-CoA racemase
MTGPLHGLRVVELGGIGPAPHASMLLADLGADVVYVERPGGAASGQVAGLRRGTRYVTADLKSDRDRASVLDLVERADVLIEGFRPGVAERLGMGPEDCLEQNPRLIYARMTGWGQDGPRAPKAGHDINYIGLTGILHAIGPADSSPAPPLNLVGDFGGGSLYLVTGILAALWERERSGAGQVIDAAIVDGAASLTQMIWALRGVGVWSDDRGSNLLDGGAPFYATYECADGGFVAVGALEPQFYAALLAGLGLAEDELPAQLDRAGWPTLRARFASAFSRRSRDDWARAFADSDACVTPVLSFAEAAEEPHLRGRGTITSAGGVPQAGIAPRFSRTGPGVPHSPPADPVEPADIRAGWPLA